MSAWLTFDLSAAILPQRPACYAIYLDGELAYIGQSANLAKRMSAHGIRLAYSGFVTRWGWANEVVIKAHFGRTYGDWAMRELRLIRRLKPRLNCVGGPRQRGAA